MNARFVARVIKCYSGGTEHKSMRGKAGKTLPPEGSRVGEVMIEKRDLILHLH